LALWIWLQSFPLVKDAGARNCLDPLGSYSNDNDLSHILGCLDHEDIARAVLFTAKEIVGDSSTSSASNQVEGSFANSDSKYLWSELFHLFHVESLQMLDTDADWRCPALRATLCYAVSENCNKREEYIPRILALTVDPKSEDDQGFNVQQILMKIISRGMDIESHGAYKDEVDFSPKRIAREGSRNDGIASPGISEVMQSGEKSYYDTDNTGDFSAPIGDWRVQTDVLGRLEIELKLAKEENDLLKKDAINSKQRENELFFELEKSNSTLRCQTLQTEAAYLERERIIKEQFENEVIQLRIELEKANKISEEGDQAKAELASLKDELDVLQHSESKLLYTEDQLRKCKEKLQEFSDIKAQLLREEEAHGKAVEQVLLLENELNQLQPLKRQLETYRIRYTDAEVKLAQCQHDLEKLRHLSKHLALENTELATTSKLCISESEQLRQKIELSSSEDCFIQSLGEGFSELNPDLKEEILRLRNENLRLNAFAAKRTNDAVTQLEEKFEDSQRLAESFKIQYLNALSELETTNNELTHTKDVVKKLKAEVEGWTRKHDEQEAELAKECARSKEAQQAAEETLERETQALLNKAASELAEKESLWTDLLESERNDAQNALNSVFRKLHETTERCNRELSELQEQTRLLIETEKQTSDSKLQQLSSDHVLAIESLRQEAANEREELIKKGKSILATKQEKHAAVLSTLKNEYESEMTRMKALYADFCEKQLSYEEKAKHKIASYKTNLDSANGKIAFLDSELENAQSQQQHIAREKEKLKEEVERLRRQVGSRMGAESDVSSAYEKLRQEYSVILEEQRTMKRQLSMAGLYATNNALSETSNTQYSNPTTMSTISQLRDEYEDTIRLLNDEKRELVMKNSATISDLQRIEQRSWQFEEEIFRLKEELTSAHLKIQRLENYSEMQPLSDSTLIHHRFENKRDTSNSGAAPVKQLSEIKRPFVQENDQNTGSMLSSRPLKHAKTASSTFEHAHAPVGTDRPPECAQS